MDNQKRIAIIDANIRKLQIRKQQIIQEQLDKECQVENGKYACNSQTEE